MYIAAEAWNRVQGLLTLIVWLWCSLTPHRKAITAVWRYRVRRLLLAFGLHVITTTYTSLLSDIVWRDIAYEMGTRYYGLFRYQYCSIIDNLTHFYILETTVFTYQTKRTMFTRLYKIMCDPTSKYEFIIINFRYRGSEISTWAK
jgi:hypothetical protein